MKKLVMIAVWLVLTAANVSAEGFKKSALDVFHAYREANQEFIDAVGMGGEVYLEKSLALEEYTNLNNGSYIQILNTLGEKYCAAPDTDIVDEFIKTLLATQNSAAEHPGYVFAELFVCDTENIASKINALDSEAKVVMASQLHHGFQNLIAAKIIQVENPELLTDKIAELNQP